jgi:hypothetical protein
LLLSYFLAVFLTAIITLFGFYALWSNGVSHSSSFSGILCTTRNKDLDDVAQGNYLGARPLGKDLAKQEVQFGILDRTENRGVGVLHTAFAIPGSVLRLRKG